MSKRSFLFVAGTGSLIVGGLIYLLFRENSHIALFFGSRLLNDIREAFSAWSNDAVNFYFADFLWGFSLCSYLLAIYVPKKRGAFFCGAITFMCGAFWEALQFVGAVNGTGDVIDIIMYFSAAVVVVIIFLKGKFK
jgi:hypothetical protein